MTDNEIDELLIAAFDGRTRVGIAMQKLLIACVSSSTQRYRTVDLQKKFEVGTTGGANKIMVDFFSEIGHLFL